MDQNKVDQLYAATQFPARDVARAERLSLELAVEWMRENNFDEVPVQDDSDTISRACIPDVEDVDFDHVIAWLPRDAFVNSTPRGGWNPVVRLRDLERKLAG